ncbi:MAG: glucuronate isomerase [Anaerolineae bacterium]
MKRETWREAILEMPVFDTHTHLNMPGVPIPAQTFWDIAHYFWFQEELWSAGYPLQAADMGEEQRVAAFVAAFNAVRNTNWHLIVRHICSDLYGVPLVDEEGRCTPERVKAVDEAVREQGQEADWSRSVVDRLAIRRIAVNNLQESAFPELPGVGVAVPSWQGRAAWVKRIGEAEDQRAAGEAARTAIRKRVAELYDQGIRGMRVAAEVFESHGKQAVSLPDALPEAGAEPWMVEAFLSHVLFEALGEHDMFAQLFLGIERDVSPRSAMAVNDPRRITNLYPLFERYRAGFELVIGAPQNNMDAAQAARIYPNAYVGGLWWYNFRQSTYNHTMQVRVEAVPAAKSSIVATDARCIEWCYGKTLLVKWLLADFLYRQVKHQWLSEDDALWVAREWLHDAAARRYLA